MKVINDTFETGQHDFLFCVTTGRTGTQTLSRILNLHGSIVGVHEAQPWFCRTDYLSESSSKKWLKNYQRKITLIEEVYLDDYSVYADTSNTFGKSWGYSLIKHDSKFRKRVGLIFLRRNLDEVVRSYMEKSCVPGQCRRWMPDIGSFPAVFSYPYELGSEHDTKEARQVWHGFEMFFRLLKILDQIGDVPLMEIRTDHISNGIGENLYEWLGVNTQEIDRDHLKLIENKRFNASQSRGDQDSEFSEFDSEAVCRSYEDMVKQSKELKRQHFPGVNISLPTVNSKRLAS